MGKQLFQETKNKVFKSATPDEFAAVFEKVLAEQKDNLANPKLITAFYTQNGFDPVLSIDHILKNKIDLSSDYFYKVTQHGLEPELFQADEIEALQKKFQDKKAIKTLDEAYHDLAMLELLSANSLINYSNAMQFGIVSPRRIYARYYTETKRPDSASMSQIFHTADIKHYLDSIQPKDPQYLALQKMLTDGGQAKGMTVKETARYLVVNMERLRWKNKPTASKFVVVNIPDYRLDVMDNGHSVLNMKVCVGEGRNIDKTNTLVEYDESDKVDRPFSRETPQLNSVIHSVQVNPVWNIPQSIASKEIIVHAANDRYYLANNNIDAYKDGEVIENPETVDWSSVNKDEYSFKQRPGNDNALGKIKFLFNNQSSVYLHDTPAKAAFDNSMRAVSHGCVRLGNPQGLAHELFGNTSKYETIVKDMGEDNPDPTTIALPNKTPIYITYMTCWEDENGTIQFRPDVYGLDIVLYAHMQKIMNKKNPADQLAGNL
ncbi:L,D-transpeptidase scaffold domain-containing protein [Mucilaginibacter segetis]|nr:L,D-transpeptidase family protein [Mucilaginibacter segetis]